MRNRYRPGRLLAGTIATMLALGLAGCGTGEPSLPDNAAQADPPRPVGMQDPAVIPTGPAAASGSCNPRASLRPSGALPPPGQMPSGTAMARIAQRGRLVVGVDQNSYNFGFRDPLTGQLTGFDIDIARQVARGIFGDPGRIQFRAISSADRIKVVQDGTVDMVVRTMTMNCERWEQVSFSTEYFTAGQRILVTRGSAAKTIQDLHGKKVCAAAGSTSIRKIAEEGTVPVSVVNWTDCLVLLQQNQVVAVSTDDSILAGLAAQDPNTVVVGPRFSDEPYGVAISKESPELVRFVNGVLAKIRSDGTWGRLYGRWLTSLGPAPSPPVARYRD
ncbi:glutamate ABC transporter substrate-binding protein [Plantactinospora sp. S1510]|uniref:Glutamate ABC transporter substrate-binding protein n=1 Tax=Plantactinospora alkalitolerans TaxID=2789879 RepID=A0ABS0H6V3_9ACTN|nr:glutamate ABC transporter substrate-binding protein [Plantactinospora alkalitolerans]MBF9134197.1 glutamate ABC transporter substrate-binding protein [Plantactinospora alkalitolerans]